MTPNLSNFNSVIGPLDEIDETRAEHFTMFLTEVKIKHIPELSVGLVNGVPHLLLASLDDVHLL